MANKPGFCTLSTLVPISVRDKLSAYLEVHGGTASGFLKTALTTALAEFNPEAKSELQLALASVQRMADRYRKVAPKCDALPNDKAVEALSMLESELLAARPAFHAVAASDIKYEPLYRNLITSTRNKLRAAQTRALVAPAQPEPSIHEPSPVRKLKDIPDVYEVPTISWVTEAGDSELVAAGYAPIDSLPKPMPEQMEARIVRDVNWLRGSASYSQQYPEWLPTKWSRAGADCVTLLLERNRALIAEGHKNAKPERLAFFERVAAHLETLKP